MTSREYARQVMEIKSEWLLEGESCRLAFKAELSLTLFTLRLLVAPHFFKPADLEALSGTKKGHVKQVGAAPIKA